MGLKAKHIHIYKKMHQWRQRQNTALISITNKDKSWPDFTCFPLFSLHSKERRERERKGRERPSMSNKAWARVLKDIFILHPTSHKISIITSSAKPGRYKLFPWIHPHTEMGCKQWCQLLKTAANWVIAGQRPKCWTLRLSTILQVWVSPQVSSSQSCPDGSGKSFFFQTLGTGWHTLLL